MKQDPLNQFKWQVLSIFVIDLFAPSEFEQIRWARIVF